ENYNNPHYIVSRSILTLKNDDVERISNLMIDQFSGEIHVYPIADSTDTTEDNITKQSQLYAPEFLKSLKISVILSGELKLK
ncbi:20624_t:CDS:1, partial [Racocetra persica]